MHPVPSWRLETEHRRPVHASCVFVRDRACSASGIVVLGKPTLSEEVFYSDFSGKFSVTVRRVFDCVVTNDFYGLLDFCRLCFTVNMALARRGDSKLAALAGEHHLH